MRKTAPGLAICKVCLAPRKQTSVSIGIASGITGIPVHTLRYWEKEFSDFLIPMRTVGGQRMYTTDAIDMVFKIKQLLRNELYSIEGAKRQLAREFTAN